MKINKLIATGAMLLIGVAPSGATATAPKPNEVVEYLDRTWPLQVKPTLEDFKTAKCQAIPHDTAPNVQGWAAEGLLCINLSYDDPWFIPYAIMHEYGHLALGEDEFWADTFAYQLAPNSWVMHWWWKP